MPPCVRVCRPQLLSQAEPHTTPCCGTTDAQHASSCHQSKFKPSTAAAAAAVSYRPTSAPYTQMLDHRSYLRHAMRESLKARRHTAHTCMMPRTASCPCRPHGMPCASSPVKQAVLQCGAALPAHCCTAPRNSQLPHAVCCFAGCGYCTPAQRAMSMKFSPPAGSSSHSGKQTHMQLQHIHVTKR